MLSAIYVKTSQSEEFYLDELLRPRIASWVNFPVMHSREFFAARWSDNHELSNGNETFILSHKQTRSEFCKVMF